MNKSTLSLALMSAALLAGSASALEIKAAIPSADVAMKNIDGREVSIDKVEGPKGTLVIFSCNACPWVKAWEGRIAEIGNTYQQHGIGVIAINSNDPGQVPEDGYAVMQQRAGERGFNFPYVVDTTSDVARAFGASHTPEAYLFDSDGKLVYHGTIDDNALHPDKVTRHYLRDALDALLKGQPVATTETKALGCSIKFRSK
jgi:peroxiredoxin